MEELNIIQGIISLGPSGILGYIAYKLWTAYQGSLDYNRESDKNNLEATNKMMNFIEGISKSQEGGDTKTHELLRDLKTDLVEKLNENKSAIMAHIDSKNN